MNKRSYSLEEDKLILTLRNSHATIDEICNQLNRSKPSISYRVYRILDKLSSIEKNKILGEKEKISEVVPIVKIPISIQYEEIEETEERIEDEETDEEEIEEIEEIEGIESETIVVPEKPKLKEVLEEVEEDEENRQHYFKEIYLPPAELDKLSLNLNPKQTEAELHYLEQLKVLQGRLIARVFELIEAHMTEHQKKIVVLMLKNKTYNSMAVLLNINYTAIAHAIKGIKTKKHGKYHGGIERKLRKICTRDECCLVLLQQILNTRQELLQLMQESSGALIEGY